MSTQREEPCPECAAPVIATDRVMPMGIDNGSYQVKFWRYQCPCGWIWANEVQRYHDNVVYRKALKAAHALSVAG